ncbi:MULTISPECIES: ATPase, T2SS/T4P/T4SS family [Myxococcaceae]|uniref:ATPase, T2SS/T4P/T4SS family n=1 Tax=Myxococcaceae TaxID=31 RepID=UPI001E3B380A|nr:MULTISPECIES: ATPase, T2SS/T4P/T4SS family [Myxococcaceae]
MTMYTESLRAFLKPVLPYLDDASVSEIMINGPEDVWIERKGKLTRTDARFTAEGLDGAARNMAQFVGRVLNEERPRLDARLPDGSRIHVVLAPVARKGTTISIRKFFKDKLTIDALLKFKSMTAQMARLIEAGIATKLNMVVAGGTGSGKTTLLNIVSSLIPDDERILTIEDSAELQLNQTHLVPFESRPPDKFGKGGVDMGDLLASALRLRPDRIVVGEVRGGEAFHLMQAMNTGHGGSLATTHANTPTDTLRRLESLCLMSGVDLPMVAVRAQVASAINLVICCERLHDGSRKTTHISEVLPLNDKGDYRTQDLFVFTPVAKDAEGHVLGYHAPTGILPTFLARARAYGFTDLDEAFFDPATYGLPPPPVFHAGAAHQVRWAPSLRHREQGRPDPEHFQDAWRELEQRLQAEARGEEIPAPRAQVQVAPSFRQDAQAAASPPAPSAPPVPVHADAVGASSPKASGAPRGSAPAPMVSEAGAMAAAPFRAVETERMSAPPVAVSEPVPAFTRRETPQDVAPPVAGTAPGLTRGPTPQESSLPVAASADARAPVAASDAARPSPPVAVSADAQVAAPRVPPSSPAREAAPPSEKTEIRPAPVRRAAPRVPDDMDDDRTPMPTPNPLLAGAAEESTVQLADELLDTRPAAPAPPRPSLPPRRPPPARGVTPVFEDSPSLQSEDPEKTAIRPAPQRPRR